MSKAFAARKQKILDQLSIPDQEYTDLSPKGSVDEGVRELCDKINRTDGYVTTSSCAGRVSVFLEGQRETTTEEAQPATSSSQGGKGGGRWLYVSHDPIDISTINKPGALFALFGIDSSSSISSPEFETRTRFVHFKFEPMILHILTASPEHAQHALSAAMSAGFRESGISGVVGEDSTPIVAIRTQGIMLESLIAYVDRYGETRPMVSEEYLRVLVQLANQRFVVNTERKERFQNALLQSTKDQKVRKGDEGDWEPANIRAERKRTEGLRRREAMRLTKANGNKVEDNSLSFGLFQD